LKLCIAIPTYDRWEADFGQSLAVTAANLVGTRADLQSLRIVKSEGSIASDGRNDLIKDALASGATHILWLDTDMVFKPKNIIGLIERDLDFVACDYRKRIAPNDTIAVGLDGKTIDWSGNGLAEVQQCGLGLTLMRTSILENMTYPWSGFYTHADGTLDDSVWFCRNARKADVKLFVDLDASRGVGHVGKQVHEVE